MSNLKHNIKSNPEEWRYKGVNSHLSKRLGLFFIHILSCGLGGEHTDVKTNVPLTLKNVGALSESETEIQQNNWCVTGPGSKHLLPAPSAPPRSHICRHLIAYLSRSYATK